MKSIWLSLLWKEWREFRWKMLALYAVLLLVFILMESILGDPGFDTLGPVLGSLLFCYGFLSAFFLGMALAAKENGTGTATFLHAIPTANWKPAAAKLFMASLTASLPIVALMALVYCGLSFDLFVENVATTVESATGSNEALSPNELLFGMTVKTVLATLSLLWWTAAIGMNRSDEIRAGAVAFLVILMIWGLTLTGFELAGKYLPEALPWLATLASGGPAGPIFTWLSPEASLPRNSFDLARDLSPWLVIPHVGVVVWFLCRFGKQQPPSAGKRAAMAPGLATRSEPKKPFRYQLVAMAWKQVWETAPLALLALAGALAISAIAYWADSSHRSRFHELFVGVTAGISFLVVLVAGIGLYLEELSPGISDFWRSRPADLRLWFVVKYFTGSIVLLMALGLPAWLVGSTQSSDWLVLQEGRAWATVGFVIWIYLLIYSLAMLMQCLVRQPIYAAVLALGTFFTGMILASWLSIDRHLHWSLLVCLMGATLILVVMLAWKTVQNNWGWKH